MTGVSCYGGVGVRVGVGGWNGKLEVLRKIIPSPLINFSKVMFLLFSVPCICNLENCPAIIFPFQPFPIICRI